MTAKRSVFLVEDHPIVLQGLAGLINAEADLTVCGHADNVADASKAILAMGPDIVVVDLFLKDSDGMELIRVLRTRRPTMPLLVLSMHNETLHAERVLRAGARGYIMKQEATENVLAAIRRVLEGDVYVSDKIASRLLSRLDEGRPRVTDAPLELLTDRQFEIFKLIGQSLGPSEIASRLSLSVKTIEAHREHIKTKLGLKSGAELLRQAMQYAMGEELRSSSPQR